MALTKEEAWWKPCRGAHWKQFLEALNDPILWSSHSLCRGTMLIRKATDMILAHRPMLLLQEPPTKVYLPSYASTQPSGNIILQPERHRIWGFSRQSFDSDKKLSHPCSSPSAITSSKLILLILNCCEPVELSKWSRIICVTSPPHITYDEEPLTSPTPTALMLHQIAQLEK